MAVLLFALSGLFAKWLALPAVVIVFGRAAFAAIAIAVFVVVIRRQSLAVSRSSILGLAITGMILAFHWGSFFQAIQISSVAIGLITFASFPLFVSFIEPWFFKEKFHFNTVLQALFTVVGIYLILPKDNLNQEVMVGIYWGLASAISFAFLTLFNRKFVRDISARKVALYQNAVAAFCLVPIMFWINFEVNHEQLAILIILGVVFTALAHSLFNSSLKVLKAQTASIAVSLEPIYGIIAAYILLNETLTLQMVLGGALVMATNIWALSNR